MKKGQNAAERQKRKEKEEDEDIQCMHGIC